MYTPWPLVCLSIALSNALILDLNLALSLDKKTPLRFMRRDMVYSNTTSPQLDLASEVTTITPSSTTSGPLLGETTTSTVSTIASSSSTSTFAPPDTSPSLATLAPFSPLVLPATGTSTTTIVTINPPPIAPPNSSPGLTTIATFSPPSIVGPVGSKPSITSVTTSANTSSTSGNIVTSTKVSAPPILKTPPQLPSITRPFTNITLSLNLSATTNTSTTSPTCTGSITYFGSVPPTVYVTVTEGFDVTVTASNASVTETPTMITPLPACEATIMPFAASYGPYFSASGQTDPDVPEFATNNPAIAPAPESSRPVVPGETPALASGAPLGASSASAASTAVYSSVDYTSTVVVTKKTPVPVVIPPTTSIDINFNFPSQNPTPPPSSGGGSNGNGGGGGGNTGNSGGGGGNNNAPATPATNNGDSFPSITVQGPTGGSLVVGPPKTTGLGNIIASIINSPFATASPTGHASGAAPFTTTVNGVPIIIQPSSVVIGGQTVAIPNLASTTVRASGAVFTVEPSKIIAPSATITISQLQHDQIVTPIPTATITTAIGDLTLTVGPTVAIISGTTYRVGEGAPATTVIVDGTRISIGSAGVGLPSTTVPPGGASASPFAVYTVEGLTFSVDATEAIVGGTTYRIGSNAPQLTTTIGPQHVSVSLGPGGVGLGSTTLTPGGPTGSPFVVYTADGLTFSVDGSEAIVSGTTYRIGTNAPQVTTTIGSGHVSVSFGPGGIGLDSTTIVPTVSSPNTQASKTSSKSTSTASPTQSVGLANAASSQAWVPAALQCCLFVLGWLVL